MRADGARPATHQSGALVERVAVVIVQPYHRPLMPGQATKDAVEVGVAGWRWPRVVIPLAQGQKAEEPAPDPKAAAYADSLEPGAPPFRVPERTPGTPGDLHRVLYRVFRLLLIAENRAGQAVERPTLRSHRLFERVPVAGDSHRGHGHIQVETSDSPVVYDGVGFPLGADEC